VWWDNADSSGYSLPAEESLSERVQNSDYDGGIVEKSEPKSSDMPDGDC
jgi:hypothetical protein